MDMPVMNIRHVGMFMGFPGMLMKMRVFHFRQLAEVVFMEMMLVVVAVAVFMGLDLMDVQMVVLFNRQQDGSPDDQWYGNDEHQADGIVEQKKRKGYACQRGCSE